MITLEVIGIIGEYNPFHKGHIYHINKIKEKYPNSLLILVLNGYFLERGEISLLAKQAKTELALKHGVDLVLELPFIYGTQAADIFASCALSILNKFGVTKIIFGSESNNPEMLSDIADRTMHPTYNAKVREFLKAGENYPTALAKALNLPDFNFLPNDLLGISYVKAIKQNNYQITYETIKRTNSYNDTSSNEAIISATNIREKLKNNQDISKHVPKDTLKYLHKIDYALFFKLLKVKIITDENLQEYLDVDEGLEYRLKKYITKAHSYEEYLTLIKTKRYTYNKLNRLFIHLLIGLKKEDSHLPLLYTRILGFTHQGQNYLKEIPNLASFTTIDKHSKLYLYEQKASLIYDLLTNSNTQSFEKQNKPVLNLH